MYFRELDRNKHIYTYLKHIAATFVCKDVIQEDSFGVKKNDDSHITFLRFAANTANVGSR
jgi:hypothetical protein